MSGKEFAAGPWSRKAWEHTASIRAAIAGLPFLRELASGRLEPRVFASSILQDEYYLSRYGKALALLAARAGDGAQLRFWAGSAASCVSQERELHRRLLSCPELEEPVAELTGGARGFGAQQLEEFASPTPVGYASWLTAVAATDIYEVAVAAVLPCFWVYAEVGSALLDEVRQRLPGHHPYRIWVEAYASPGFASSVHEAVQIYEIVARGAGDVLRTRMLAAFERATCFELLFWRAAQRGEQWS